MNTWAIATSDAQKPSASDFWSGLGGAVGAIGEPDFGSQVLGCLNQVLPVDFWSVYQVGSDLPPKMYVSASLSTRDVSADCFQRYRQGLYKTDQTFASARAYADAGSLAMTLRRPRKLIYRYSNFFGLQATNLHHLSFLRGENFVLS